MRNIPRIQILKKRTQRNNCFNLKLLEKNFKFFCFIGTYKNLSDFFGYKFMYYNKFILRFFTLFYKKNNFFVKNKNWYIKQNLFFNLLNRNFYLVYKLLAFFWFINLIATYKNKQNFNLYFSKKENYLILTRLKKRGNNLNFVNFLTKI